MKQRLHNVLARLRLHFRRQPVPYLLAAIVLLAVSFFFQGGGWNQNAHFATTVALVEDGTVVLDRYRRSTGDLSRAGDSVVSAKPIGTALVAIPGYLVARTLTLGVDNRGNRVILRAYLTSVLTAGLALVGCALLLWRILRRRLGQGDAALLALGTTLATPLWPNSTMLTSHPLVAVSALWAYDLLEAPRLSGSRLSSRRLLLAGVAASLPAMFEYMTAVLLLPLGAYALWQVRPRRQILWFAAGVVLVAAVPLLHHALTYGNPLHTGYNSLVNARFAADAQRGFMGFDGLSLARLYQLTFGGARGFFFLSPFLIAAVPGLVLMLRRPESRPEGLVAGSCAWMILLLVASLAYWHSGSAVGSRYALLFVAFSAIPLAAMVEKYRLWVLGGIVVGAVFMLLATSVTAIPPTPEPRPPYTNVIGWLWQRFEVGTLASWQQAILVEAGHAAGRPTLPFAFNLGQLVGLSGHLSLAPFVLGMGSLLVLLRRAVRMPTGPVQTSDSPQSAG